MKYSLLHNHGEKITMMQQRSTDFVVNRILMKLFKTNNMDVVSYCRTVSC